MQTTAAICCGPGRKFELETVELDEPRDTEVLVRLTATGLCHTDISVREGKIPFPAPAVLGHEGAGVVEAVGPGVTMVHPGDRVLMMSPSCGQCRPCHLGHPALCEVPELRWAGVRADGSHIITRDGAGVSARFLGQSSFSRHALVEERTVLAVVDEVPATTLAPFGCAVVTGAGTILNVLRPQFGESVVVLGAGAVGLSAVMAAALTPASQIVAVDVVPERLALAAEVGATDTVNATDAPDLVSAIKDLTGGRGADKIVESTGNVAVLAQGLAALGRGGTLGLVGASGAEATVALPVIDVISGARGVRGAVMGDGSAPFLRTLIGYHLRGRLPIDRLVRTYAFEDIELAVADSVSGATVKAVLTFG